MLTKVDVLSTGESAEYYTDERCYILELSNDAGDPDVSVARARVEAGITTRSHRLSNTAERYVILKGEGEAIIGDAPPTRVAVGSVVWIPAGVTQSIRNIGDTDLVFLCICTPRFEWQNYESVETT